MDAKQAAALRKEFPAALIGKLPKGGTMLDFVGHAACTDRLLQVDPGWNWEPMAYDMGGLPLLDGNHNLWIKLTVCGVTRIGVGDGKSLKECIGDAIRNAAMRFGVALDLWAKEDLHAMDEPLGLAPTGPPPDPGVTRTMSRRRPTQTDDAAEPAAAGQSEAHTPPLHAASSPGPGEGMSSPGAALDVVKGDHSTAQLAKIHILLGEQGMGERVAGLACLSDILNREVTSSKSLSKREAGTVIEALTTTSKPATSADVEPVWE